LRLAVILLTFLSLSLRGQALPPSSCHPPDSARAVLAVRPVDPKGPVILIDSGAATPSDYPDPGHGVFDGRFSVRFVHWWPSGDWREDTTYFTLSPDTSGPQPLIATGWASDFPLSAPLNRRKVFISKDSWGHLAVDFYQPGGMEDAPSLAITLYSDTGFQGWRFVGPAVEPRSVSWFCATRD